MKLYGKKMLRIQGCVILALFLLSNVLFGQITVVRNQMHCEECGKLIVSNQQYLVSGDLKFCSTECYDKYVDARLPVCVVCGKKFKEGFVCDDKHYCSQKCLNTLYNVCAYCKKPKPSGFFNGDIFLCDHCNELPRCSSCNMPYGAGAKRIADGRVLCGSCALVNIFSLEKATDIIGNVRMILERKFQLTTNHTITFDLCLQPDIARELGSSATDRERGLYVHSSKELTLFGLKLKKEDKYQIFILAGLAENLFRTVSAHELAHDWMGLYLPHIKELKVREGFAEYVSWKYAQSQGDTQSMHNIEGNLDEIYGGGFREMKELLDGGEANASAWKATLLKLYPAPVEDDRK